MIEVISRGDTAPVFQRRLKNELGEVIDLNDVTDVDFHMRDERYESIVDDNLSGNVQIADADKGEAAYEWQSGDTDAIGTYMAEFVITFSDGTQRTFPQRGSYTIEIMEDIND